MLGYSIFHNNIGSGDEAIGHDVKYATTMYAYIHRQMVWWVEPVAAPPPLPPPYRSSLNQPLFLPDLTRSIP